MTNPLADQIVESLSIANRVTTYLLEAVCDDALGAPIPRGWNLSAQFAHIHNVRLMWLDSAKAAVDLKKLETKGSVYTGVILREALDDSAREIEQLVSGLLAENKRMPGFKPHTPAFVTYLVSHQAYHHAEIGIIARDIGQPIDKKHAFGLWEWGVR